MGILNAHPQLKAQEVIRWQCFASRAVNSWRTSGGKLYLTDQRMYFQPTRIDSLLGGRQWECPIGEVQGVEIIDRNLREIAGALRERLGIRTPEGVEMFVVNKVSAKAEELHARLN